MWSTMQETTQCVKHSETNIRTDYKGILNTVHGWLIVSDKAQRKFLKIYIPYII